MQVDSRRRESTQTTILALLLAQKGGCTLRQLDKDYYELEGEHIPWREFGYTSLLSFLHSMSKTVKLEDRDNTTIVKGIASEKSKHVSKLVAGQKETKQPTGRKTYKPSHYYPRTAPQRIHIRAEVLSSIVTLIENHPEGLHKNYLFQRVQACMPFTNITISDMEEQLQELSHIIFQNNNKFYSVEHKVTNSNDHGKNKDIPCLRVHSPVEEKPKSSVVTVAGDEDYDDILDYDDEDISEFMPSNKKPTSCYRKNSVSKGQDQVADCKPLVQTAHSELDNLHISKHNDNYETMTEFNNNVNEHKEQCLNSNDVEILINERLKFRLEKLIQNHPNGIWCADLPEKYLEEYKVPLNYIELGFNSVREFAAELPHIFHCIQPHDKGDFMLHYAKKKVPLNEVKEKPTTQNLAQLYQIYETPNDEALPVTVSLNTCKELIPDDVMSIGESVGHLSVTDFDQMDQPYIEVVVVEVFTPSFFWIQLRKQQNIFKKFMDDLHIFYTTNTEQYTIPPVVLEKGLNCACLYNGIWHRGIIKTVKPDLQVTVMFYDYGTLKTYSPDEVYYLHRKFSYLPAQAIPCGLVNVKPYRGSKWSRSVTHSFAVRTSQAPLIATIALINSEDNSMMVTLTDTLEEEDVHINDWLVEQKLAEHGRMDNKVDMSSLLLYVEENLLFSPEKCYEEEASNGDNKNSPENATNVPLISPQSYLNNAVCGTPSEFKAADERMNSARKLFMEKESTEAASEFTTFTSHKSNTNPFAQDEHVHGSRDSIIRGKTLLQLWHENLQMQIQITGILNIILHEIVNKLGNKGDASFQDIQNMMKTIRNALLLSKLEMDTTVAHAKENSENMCKSSAGAYSDISMYDSLNTTYPVKYSTLTTTNEVPLSTSLYNKNHNLDTCTELHTQNFEMQNAFKNLAPLNFATSMLRNNDICTVNQYFGSDQIKKEPRVAPGFEGFVNNLKRNEQNYFSNSVNNAFVASQNDYINNVPKETNPFKLSLKAQKESYLHSSTLCKSYEPAPQFNMCSTLTGDRDSSVNHGQYIFNESFSNTGNIPKSTRVLNEMADNYNRTVNGVSNSLSKITTSDQPVEHSVQFYEKTNKHERSDITEKANLNPFKENFTTTANCNLNNDTSFTLLLNSVEHPTVGNKENIDDGHFTRSSTSHTIYNLSPTMQLINEAPVVQERGNKELIDLSRKKIWSASFKDTYCGDANIPFNGNEEIVTYNKEERRFDDATVNVSKFHPAMENLERSKQCVNGDEAQYSWGDTQVPQYLFLNKKVFFQVVDLPNRIIHVFYYKGEGWLLVDELLKPMTVMGATLSTTHLPLIKEHVRFEDIDRAAALMIIVNKPSILPKATQDILNEKSKLCVMQLESALNVLQKIYTQQKDMRDISEYTFFENDIWVIRNTYRQLMYHIDCGQ